MSNKDNINNFFKIIKSIFEFLQVFLFFNAFVSCLYWILVLCDIKIEILDNYFQIALDFVNQFYTFEDKKKDTGVNLSLFIVSVINLLGAFAINYIRDFILSFEAEVNRAKRIAYKREAKKQSEEIKKNYIMEMQKFNKFIYACRVKIARKSNEIFDSEVTEEEVLDIKERIYEDIKGLIQIYNPLRSLGNQDGIIFQINNFKKINEFLQVLSDNKKIMIKKYTKKGIKIKFLEFIDPMTIGQIIAEPLQISGVVPQKDIMDCVLYLMARGGVSKKLYNSFPHELDGGRRQRVGIIRALALNPSFIVCDEPVSSLDVSIQAQILNLLQDLQQSMGLTFLFISHDLSVVRQISNRIVVMYLGQMMEVCDSKGLFKNPLHPYTKALLSAVPIAKYNYERKDRILLKGDVPSPVDPKPGCRFAKRCWMATDECFNSAPCLSEVEPGHFVACHKCGK